MSRRTSPPRRPRACSTARLRRVAAGAVVPVVLLTASAVVWQTSYAAFTAKTVNPSNSWTAGSVSLSDSQGGSSAPSTGTALWTGDTGLKPGSTGTRCIRVTYTGNLASAVKMYVAPGGLTGTLGTYMRLSVDTSPTGAAASCSDFGTATNIYNQNDADDTKTLAAYAAAANSFTTGIGSTMIGAARLRIPAVGSAVVWWHSRRYAPLTACATALAVLSTTALSRPDEPRAPDGQVS